MLRSERLEEIRKERMNTAKLWAFEVLTTAAMAMVLCWVAWK